MSTDAAAETLFLNPFEPGFFDDPHRFYAPLREQVPVHQSPIGPWMVFRYEDCLRLLRDPTLSVDQDNAPTSARAEQFEALLEGRERRGSRSILSLDPPDHTRLRKLVSKAFTPRMVADLRPRVQQLVDDILDDLAERADDGPVDLVPELAFPLPFTVISEMLGMPDADRDQLRAWSHTITKTLDPLITEDDVRASLEAGDHMNDHITEVVEWKRQHPADDLLTGLLAAEDEGDRLTHEELLDQVVLIYIAGHETTVNLIGNGTLALLRNRAELERLAADPDLDVGAVDELLRYDSPVQFSGRITTKDIVVGGADIPDGSFVMTCLGSANRDPAKWGDDADRLDVGRAGAGEHVSFGGGLHRCLGANLARVEAQVAIGSLIRRFPDLELAGEPVSNNRIVLHGLDSLPVALHA